MVEPHASLAPEAHESPAPVVAADAAKPSAGSLEVPAKPSGASAKARGARSGGSARPASSEARASGGRGAPRQLSTAALVIYAFAVALGIGVGSAYMAVGGEYPIGEVRIGPWRTWPQVGARNADPYARMIVTRRGDIPLATGEGLAMTATVDSEGRGLDSGCTYRLEGMAPQARLWTLTLYDGNGALASSALERSAFTSAEVLRAQDGRVAVTLSRDLQPGNWLKLPDTGSFRVTLRLYDSPAAVGTASVETRALPTITRLECGA